MSLGLILGMLSGCSFTHPMIATGRDAPAIAIDGAQQRSLAVVMAGVPSELSTNAGAHTFVLKNARGVFERTAYTSLAKAFKTVRFVENANEPNFDLYLYPTLTLASAGSAPARMSVELKVTDSQGRQLSVGSAQSSEAGMVFTLPAGIEDLFLKAAHIALPQASQALVAREVSPPPGATMPAAPPSTVATNKVKRQGGGK